MDPAPVVRISLVRFFTEMWCPAILNFSFHSSFWWRSASPQMQGLTLVHFSAQLERFVQDRGCTEGLCSPC